MKKILALILLVIGAISFTACLVNHNDGVCDYKGCKTTLGVIRYDKDHELCLKHAIEIGLNG